MIAIWSNAPRDEDSAGQRFAYATSTDGITWSDAKALVSPPREEDGQQSVLTAAGFYEYQGTLVAYYGQYRNDRTHTNLWCLTTTDGITWSQPIDLKIGVNPNDHPRRLASGKLLICGNLAFPTTDDPTGLSGWKMRGLYPAPDPATGRPIEDNPATFWKVQEKLGWPAALCEGSFIQTPDGIIRMMLRATGPGFKGRLWQSDSSDDGEKWSQPIETSFPDNDAKIQFGRLNDGRYFYLGTPDPEPHWKRCPLVLSLSADGLNYTQHYVVADEPYVMKHEGRYKAGEYGYSRAIEHDGKLNIVCSRQKEAIEFLRVRIADLTP